MFKKQLEIAEVEKDVENAYRAELLRLSPSSEITSKHGVDGVLVSKHENNNIKCLMEFKYNLDFNKKEDVAKVLIQAIYYCYKMSRTSITQPNVLFFGSKNNCFVIHFNDIFSYLKMTTNWDIAPSSAFDKNPEMRELLLRDNKINPFIFDIEDTLEKVWSKIYNLNKDISYLIRIHENNIKTIFDGFAKIFRTPLLTNELVMVFINTITDPEHYYVRNDRESVKDFLYAPNDKKYPIFRKNFDAYFNHFEREYNLSEKERLVSICDRLIEDLKRRRDGAFFTPTLWVNEAHLMIEEAFGEDWREKYIVWDCACGTGNLTRDYRFKELYCSTLLNEELEIMKQNRISEDATRFQFDFLNDDINKVPAGLKKALDEGKEIIFFINPPYGKATPRKGEYGTGMTDTMISDLMKKSDMGLASSQLYAQFLFRINEFNKKNNINIALFAKSMYKASSSFSKFRKMFFNKFKYFSGMLFNAKHFSDTSDAWGIDFSIWKSGKESNNSFEITVKDFTSNEIVEKEKKIIYNLDDDEDASSWFDKKQSRNIVYPNMSSALKINNDDKLMTKDAIGAINLHANIQMQQQVVFITSGAIGANGHKAITPENFRRACDLFTVRKCIPQDWINDKDEYMKPFIHPELKDAYKQWSNDCIIYSLFNTSSQQSSLRNVSYKRKNWDIINHWFFFSEEAMKKLALKYNYDDMVRDTRNFPNDRFVFNQLKNLPLSKEAKAVLNKVVELTVKSFPFRQSLNAKNPEFNLQCWDAGWYQIKLILKEHLKEELVIFQKLYKELEEKLAPDVYTFMFLK